MTEVMNRMPIGDRLVHTRGGVARVGLTLIGAGALIVGSFLEWLAVDGATGRTAEIRAFWSTDVEAVGYFASAGFLLLLVALVALAGLLSSGGLVTAVMGLVSVAAFAMFWSTWTGTEDLGIGMWLILAGGVTTLIGGALGLSATRQARPAPTL